MSGRCQAFSLESGRSELVAVLLDLGLPDREGLELVPVIAKTGAALLVISAREATQETPSDCPALQRGVVPPISQ